MIDFKFITDKVSYYTILSNLGGVTGGDTVCIFYFEYCEICVDRIFVLIICMNKFDLEYMYDFALIQYLYTFLIVNKFTNLIEIDREYFV